MLLFGFAKKNHCLFGVLIEAMKFQFLKYFICRFCLPNVVLAPFPPEKIASDCQQAICIPMNPYGVEEPQRKNRGGTPIAGCIHGCASRFFIQNRF